MTVRISVFFLPDFSLATWMSDQGLSFDGSLSTALAAALFKKLGIDAFLKSPACERSEAPYSVNRIEQTGWSSGNKVSFTLCLSCITSVKARRGGGLLHSLFVL